MLRSFQRFRRRRAAADARPDILTWHGCARDAYDAMLRHFALDGGALFREHNPTLPIDRRYAYLWPYGQAWSATLDLARLGDERELLAQADRLRRSFFRHYWDTQIDPPGGAAYPVTAGGGEFFYDDNAWIGLALVELARVTGDSDILADAARVFAFVASGWDDDPRHPAPGGVFWKQDAGNPRRDRNTCVNGPGARLGGQLAALTGDRRHAEIAARMFGWVEETLRDPDDGLYWDNLKLDGAIDRTKWTYNQGTMIGAAVVLARLDRDDALLARARATAEVAVAHYGAHDRLWGQDPPFNGIFFDNLRLLGDALGDHTFYLPLLTEYAARIWMQGRDARTGLCHFGRRDRVDLITQAAAVRTFAILASVADR